MFFSRLGASGRRKRPARSDPKTKRTAVPAKSSTLAKWKGIFRAESTVRGVQVKQCQSAQRLLDRPLSLEDKRAFRGPFQTQRAALDAGEKRIQRDLVRGGERAQGRARALGPLC